MLHDNTWAEVEIPTANGFTGHTWTVGTPATALHAPPRPTEPPLVRCDSQSISERYELLRHLGEGGMGELYLARRRKDRKLVAIKRIRNHLTDRNKIFKMFRDEATLAARIDHPNVVRVVDLETDSDDAFIAMEYVAGKTLADLLRRVRPPQLICAGIVAQVADGLHAAHELRDEQGQPVGTVHQDVSPQNIIIGYDGVVKLIDFGVAHTRETTRCVDINSIRGKLPYMAPEQVRAEPLDRRVDVFALGIVLYEMTTMTRLFKTKTIEGTRERILHGPIIPPSHLVPDYPEDLERIVLKALDRDPSRRYQTAAEMRDALREVLGHRWRTIGNAISSMMSQVFGNRRVRRQIESPRVHQLLAGYTRAARAVPTPTAAPITAAPIASAVDDDEVTRVDVGPEEGSAEGGQHERLLRMLGGT